MARYLIWRIGNFAENRQIKNTPILFHTLPHYAEALAIAKFKIRQCILMTDSPNLMLAKVSRYTVCYAHKKCSCFQSFSVCCCHTEFSRHAVCLPLQRHAWLSSLYELTNIMRTALQIIARKSSHTAIEPSQGRLLPCFCPERMIVHHLQPWPHPLN